MTDITVRYSGGPSGPNQNDPFRKGRRVKVKNRDDVGVVIHGESPYEYFAGGPGLENMMVVHVYFEATGEVISYVASAIEGAP